MKKTDAEADEANPSTDKVPVEQPKVVDAAEQPKVVGPAQGPCGWGLVVRGFVEKRVRKRVGDRRIEVVTYTLGPKHVEFDVFEPESYWAKGEFVEVEVNAKIFRDRVTLTAAGRSPGEEF